MVVCAYRMRFYQTRDGDRYVYETEDIFGTIRIASERALDPQSLDLIVMGILGSGATEGKVTDRITFTFDKRPAWDESEDEPEVPQPSLIHRLITFLWKSLKRS